jgi:hypothetical protein
MANERDKSANPQGGPMDSNVGGKTAGSNTQSQGGISHKVAERARAEFDPAMGIPNGPLGSRTAPMKNSLDQGDGSDAGDGREQHGFSGDDGEYEPTFGTSTGSTGTPASLQTGPVGDLGAQQDRRVQGMPSDPAERTTGADTPNRGGVAGSPGGPRAMSPDRLPGQGADEGVSDRDHRHNDGERDSQI